MIPGTFIAARNKSNGYADPARANAKQPWQRITVFQDQDTAITESMGWDFDRSDEFLGNTDIVIAHARRRLMEAARALRRGQGSADQCQGLSPARRLGAVAARRAILVGRGRRADGHAAGDFPAGALAGAGPA